VSVCLRVFVCVCVCVCACVYIHVSIHVYMYTPNTYAYIYTCTHHSSSHVCMRVRACVRVTHVYITLKSLAQELPLPLPSYDSIPPLAIHELFFYRYRYNHSFTVTVTI